MELERGLTLCSRDVCALTAAKGVCSGSIESIFTTFPSSQDKAPFRIYRKGAKALRMMIARVVGCGAK
jgi:hypothetical protein